MISRAWRTLEVFLVVFLFMAAVTGLRADELPVSLGPITIGEVAKAAKERLTQQGCRKYAWNSLDEPEALLIRSEFDYTTLNELRRGHWWIPLAPNGINPSISTTFMEIFHCPGRQVFFVSEDRSSPARVATVTFAFCSTDERSGAQTIYDKVGTKNRTRAGGDMPALPMFFPRDSAGDKLQATSLYSPIISDWIFSMAYKKPDGCRLDGRPVGYLYALMFMSRPIVLDAIEKEQALHKRAIERIKPPSKL